MRADLRTQDVVVDSMNTPAPMTLDEARKKFPPIWTVYENPRDYPGKWVVRMWWGENPEPEAGVCDSLELARALIRDAGGSFCLNRAPADDPAIHESWI